MAVKELSESTWDKEVLKSDKPVLVDFWAPWCGPCRMQGPIVEQLAKQVGDTAVVAKLNTDENQALAMRYNIQGIPSLLVFKGGKPVQSFVGVTAAEALKRALAA
jgi:thioredoxin 1